MASMSWLKRFFRRNRLPLDVKKVESALGYHFRNAELLFRSLKHRSYSQENDGHIDLSNERLEFLGDTVLNLVVSHYLFLENPVFQEGELTKLKSALVSKTSAALAGRGIGLQHYVLLSESEEVSGGRNRSSIIADTYEAIIGAMYLDGGLTPPRDFIHATMLSNVPHVLGEIQKNYKSLLLEMTQAHKLGHPVYRTVSEEGPDHEKIFTVDVLIKGDSYGIGRGKNKKAAQQMASKEGISLLSERIGLDPQDVLRS